MEQKRLTIKETGTYPNGNQFRFQVRKTEDLWKIWLVPQITKIGNSYVFDQCMWHAIFCWNGNIEDVRADLLADLPADELPGFPGIDKAVWVGNDGWCYFWLPGDGIYSDDLGGKRIAYEVVRGGMVAWEAGKSPTGMAPADVGGVTLSAAVVADAEAVFVEAEVVIDEGRSTED
jgi:hypothetical protein